jgi:predicted SAM-dependent methyltransferase
MKGLNLGCGTRFHPDWTNIDVTGENSQVQLHDVRESLPFPDDTFDVVYHSHLLEHLPKEQALPFCRECYRVLRNGGIVRVVVPDLERIAKLYLRALDQAMNNSRSDYDYTWMMIELYDQVVRDRPGGAMLEYLKQDPIPNESTVYGRLGDEARRIVQRLHASAPMTGRLSVRGNWRDDLCRWRDRLRTAIVRRLLSQRDYQALQLGRFRLSGEIHQWMYDRYSLCRLLEASGFQAPQQRTESDSVIDNWAKFNLDTDNNGTAYKPDSLYVEATKASR